MRWFGGLFFRPRDLIGSRFSVLIVHECSNLLRVRLAIVISLDLDRVEIVAAVAASAAAAAAVAATSNITDDDVATSIIQLNAANDYYEGWIPLTHVKGYRI